MTDGVQEQQRFRASDLSMLFGKKGSLKEFGILGALVVIVVAFQIVTEGTTLSSNNLINIIQSQSYILILAVGMVMVIIAGHIDLSVGSVAAFVGVVVVSLVLSRNGKMLDDPEVVMEGIPSERPGGGAMEDMVLDVVEGTIESIPPKRRGDVEMVREAVRRAVRSSIDQVWGKKSVVRVMVSQLDVKG